MGIYDLAGQQLDEYELRDLLGRGGMSAVYRAYQDELERYVAVKVLPQELASKPGYTKRFQREAKTAAALEHTNIVPIYDFGNSNNLNYVVMRLLQGGTLEDRMLAAAGTLTPDALLPIVAQVAQALDYAHANGVVHRDIKPSNIMFDEHGGVYLVDFGIAKAVQQDMALTAENIVLGTPLYMAPEQWRGEALTQAVDQYALAVLVQQALTGQMPFEADTPHEYMHAHLNAPVPAAHDVNPALPAAISSVLQRALAKEASERYASVGAFVQALQVAANPNSAPTIENTIAPDYAQPTVENQRAPNVGSLIPAAETVPMSAQPSPANAPVPHPAANRAAPIPRGAPDDAIGTQTIMRRMAAGGVAGVVLLIAFLGVIALAVAYITSPREPAAPQVGAQTTSIPGEAPTTFTPRPTSTPLDQTAIAATVAALGPVDATATALAAFFGTQEGVGVIGDIGFPTRIAPPPTTGIRATAPPLIIGDANFGSIRLAQRLFNQPAIPVRDAAFSADGQMIASAHGDGRVRVWRGGPQGSFTTLSGHPDVASAVAFSPDATLLASGGRDNATRIWEVQTARQRTVYFGHTADVRDVAFSPDGTVLATASEDETVRIWDVASGQTLRTLRGHGDRVLALAFSPDGRTLATGSGDSSVILWNAETGGQVASFVGHNEEVRSLAFSADGRLLASTSTDNRTLIYDLGTRNLLRTLRGHNTDVFSVAFHPDSALIATGGRDNDIILWDVGNGVLLTRLEDHAGWVLGLGFSADGRQLLSASGDGSVRLWALETNE